MREIVQIAPVAVGCRPVDVLALQGVPRGFTPEARVQALVEQALELFASLAAPIGLLDDVTADEFAAILPGEGVNAPANPVAAIHPRADDRALFAVTVGEALSDRIAELFRDQEFALGAMLDAAASNGAERTAQIVERHYRARLEHAGGAPNGRGFLRYSPGYCGWHVSGQRKLFSRLRPEEIGITLRDSYLMEPLKSISGVILGGPAEIHSYENDFPFCDECKGKECRARIRQVLEDSR